MLGIGIDTGGTYTDAVVYDYEQKKVIAKGKTLTTKENLEVGIGNVVDALPAELLKKAEVFSLSTTLATNACVENKGGRAKLILMGTTRKILDWIDAKTVYGLKHEDLLCIETKSSFDGKIIDHPDWDAVMEEEQAWFADAQALAVAEVNAMRNGGACEKTAKEKLTERYEVPFVMGCELAADFNVMERGATALLNARLLPTIEEFMAAVKSALEKRQLTNAKEMIVRSDGSLMAEETALTYPVQTILSGPAASIMGGRAMADCPNSLIIDMGGTTTDISIVRNNEPALTDGISIGGFRTQIKGVYIDTFGLGGDSRIAVEEGRPALHTRRVRPLCAAAAEFPQIKKELEKLIESGKRSNKPLHEALYLVRRPRERAQYNAAENELIDRLAEGPILLGSGALDLYNLNSDRLEDEGIVMRCGLTPTDIMHIKGEFDRHDREASVLAARYLLSILPRYEDTEEDMKRFCDDVYELVCRKLYENILRVMLINRYPKTFRKGVDEQMMSMIRRSWDEKEHNGFFGMDFFTDATLVGIGAPTHIFLPTVAEKLGTRCVIPEHAEVANAVGAIVSDISAEARISVSPDYSSGIFGGYLVCTAELRKDFETLEEAVEFAKAEAETQAIAEARSRGALGELSVKVEVTPKVAYSKEGTEILLDTFVTARAAGRV